MTRVEEIKARSQRTTGVEYIQPCSLDDIEYLLARNEELQRRVERLEKVAERSRSMVDLFIEKVESGAARSKKTYEDALAVREELLALDAKEQDDD